MLSQLLTGWATQTALLSTTPQPEPESRTGHMGHADHSAHMICLVHLGFFLPLPRFSSGVSSSSTVNNA